MCIYFEFTRTKQRFLSFRRNLTRYDKKAGLRRLFEDPSKLIFPD